MTIPRSHLIAAVGVAVASTLLLQAHSISFWTSHTGPFIGWVWSIALDCAAIWLWYRGGYARVLAALGSLLLIAGPLYVLSSPVMERLAVVRENAALDELMSNEIKQQQTALDTFLRNSTKRLGWSGRIDQAQVQLAEIQQKRRELLRNGAALDLRDIILPMLQATALLVVLLTQILAISSLRQPGLVRASPVIPRRNTKKATAQVVTKPTVKSVSRPVTSEPGDGEDEKGDHVVTESIEIAETLRNFMSINRINQREAANSLGVRAADISMLLNHTERHNQGKETISRRALSKIESGLQGPGCDS